MSGGARLRGEGERLSAARDLLVEALHSARAHGGSLGPPSAEPGVDEAPEAGELTRHGRELLGVLWPQPMAPTRRERLLDVVRRYVDRAEALARRRDRFVHEFRTEHGFDRSAYTPDEASRLASGLARLDAEAAEGLEVAAQELLEISPGP